MNKIFTYSSLSSAIFILLLVWLITWQPFTMLPYRLIQTSLLLIFLSFISLCFHLRGRSKKWVTIVILILSLFPLTILVLSVHPALLIAGFNQNISQQEIDEDLKMYESTVNDIANYRELTKTNIDLSTRLDIHKKISLELSRLNDGHSYVLPFQPIFNTMYLPMTAYYGQNGLEIIQSSEKEWVGKKLIAINGVGIDQLYSAISEYMGADNDFYKKYMFSYYLFSSTILNHMGVHVKNEVELEFDDGSSSKAETIPYYIWLYYSLKPQEITSFRGYNLSKTNYRIETRGDTVFWRIFEFKNKGEKTFTRATSTIQNLFTDESNETLIIDLTACSGGDNTVYNDFLPVATLLSAQGIEITVFTSWKTFSAAVNFISELSDHAEFLVMGQPTGAGHNHLGDPQFVMLPNSKVMYFISTRHWVFKPGDSLKTIEPDSLIDLQLLNF